MDVWFQGCTDLQLEALSCQLPFITCWTCVCTAASTCCCCCMPVDIVAWQSVKPTHQYATPLCGQTNAILCLHCFCVHVQCCQQFTIDIAIVMYINVHVATCCMHDQHWSCRVHRVSAAACESRMPKFAACKDSCTSVHHRSSTQVVACLTAAGQINQ